MTTPELQSTEPKPERPRFQFSLRTLLLLFVVLGSSLAVFGGWGILVFGLAVELAIYVHRGGSLSFAVCVGVIVLGLICLHAMLFPGVEAGRETGRRVACSNNLKDIALALHDYHRANGCFPPAYIADKTGKPMHSWRVLILPYLDRNDLYKAYDFTEPWDGPKNKRLLTKCPQIYLCPSDPPASISAPTPTSYVAVVGPRAAWEGEKPRKLADFAGETSNTIMLVEVADSHILWTEPRDLSLDTLGVTDAKSPPLVVSSYHGQREEFFFTYDRATGINVALADYGVRCWWLGNRSTEDLRKLLEIGGFRREESGESGRRLNWPNIAALAVWLLSVGTLLTCAVRSRKVLSVPPPPS